MNGTPHYQMVINAEWADSPAHYEVRAPADGGLTATGAFGVENADAAVAGGTRHLIEVVGESKAMRILLAGVPMSSEEAELAGLVAEVVPDERCLAAAVDLAHRSRSTPRSPYNSPRTPRCRTLVQVLAPGWRTSGATFFLVRQSGDRREGSRRSARRDDRPSPGVELHDMR